MNCKFCGAEILFIETAKGGKMPCEARKIQVWRTDKGKITACNDRGETFKCSTESSPFVASEYAYPVHWQNCTGQKNNL